MKTFLLLLGANLLALFNPATANETADYTAHEWGTFTSVQGADGVQIEWNPLLLTELPKFVYDRNRPRAGAKPMLPIIAAKTALVARQRLETPVIYFYSKEERVVDVTVKFPGGRVTEWYPQQNPLPRATVKPGEPAARWEKMRILSKAQPEKFLREATGSHYYAARETEANPVQIAPPGAPVETDKFLFYRGVGGFEAPLNVTQDGEALRLANTGKDELRDLFVCDVRERSVNGTRSWALTFARVENLAAGATLLAPRIATDLIADKSAELALQLRTALERAGLFAPEAAAMVRTWEKSWLGEPGSTSCRVRGRTASCRSHLNLRHANSFA